MLRRARPLLPLIACYLLLAPGCARRAPAPQAWLWPGADCRNSLLFGQAGTRPGRLEYRRVWDAEYFGDEPQFCGPVADARGPLLALADLDRDRRLEIIPAGPHRDLDLVLWATGVAVPPGGEPAGLVRHGRILLGSDAAATTLPLPAPVGENDEPTWLVTLNGRPHFVGFFEPTDPAKAARQYALVVSDTAGRIAWSAPLAPMPMLWAVTDLDGDGSDDLLVGTYGEEHGLRRGGTTDSESTYCIAFNADGRHLWQTAFALPGRAGEDASALPGRAGDDASALPGRAGDDASALPGRAGEDPSRLPGRAGEDPSRLPGRAGEDPSRFLGCRAAVADLDGDGRVEVAVAVYTWQHGSGGLHVLDGTTGRIRASLEGPENRTASHVSLGAADLDGDGHAEIVATTVGPESWLDEYRFRSDSIVPVASRLLGATGTRGRERLGSTAGKSGLYYGLLHAICDLDGDGRLELVASGARCTPVCCDPVFYPSRVDSSRIAIFDHRLEPVLDLPLPGRCRSLALGDLLPGGNIEILVRTDRLTLYTADR